MTPCVSVLVTVYNREAYLASTLESILNSKFDDFEVIVVDDNSSDRSLEVANSFARRDSRIQVYSNEKNLGDYNNRNRAASFATGKYLKYLDADDLIYKHSLSTMVEALERFPQAAFAISSNVIDPPHPYPTLYSSEEVYRRHYLSQSVLGAGPSASIIRRDAFEVLGGFSGKQFVGDSELWLTLAENWQVVSLQPALVWWRKHEQQQMQLELSKPVVISIRYSLELELLELTKHLSMNQKMRAREYLDHIHARRLWSLALKRRRLKTAQALFRDSNMSGVRLLKGLRKPRQRS